MYEFKKTDGAYVMRPDYRVEKVDEYRWRAFKGEQQIPRVAPAWKSYKWQETGDFPTLSEAKMFLRRHKREANSRQEDE